MTSKPALTDTKKSFVAIGLVLLVLVLVVVAFIAAKPWLKTTIGGPMFSLVAAALAILAMGFATYFSIRLQRGQDEVQQASMRFAAQWGMTAGQIGFVLLLLLPPFKDFATGVVGDFAGDPGVTVDQDVVVFAMVIGFMGVTLLQTIALAVFNAIWWSSRQ